MKKEFAFAICAALLMGASQIAKHDYAEVSIPAREAHVSPKSASFSAGAELAKPDPSTQLRILKDYGKRPLAFEKNQGQTDSRVKFLSRNAGYTLFLTADEAVFSLPTNKANDKWPTAGGRNEGQQSLVGRQLPNNESKQQMRNPILRLKLVGGARHAAVRGVDELPGKSNYFLANDPKKWRSNVPTYAKVKYEEIYSGIDLVYYGNQQNLEYDFIVAPGADPRRIAFSLRGTKRIRRDERGDLVLKMRMGEDEIRWHKPVAYQEENGTRQLVAVDYAVKDKNRVGFELGGYDASRPLYIDPLIYSTYLGGSGGDNGLGIAVDSSGNVYVTGSTNSTNFPTMSPHQSANGEGVGGTAFVTKFNASGSALVYSTYLGGSNGSDVGNGIAVDSSGNVYVTGRTTSTNFPTVNQFQFTNGGGVKGTAFVTKLDASGSFLAYSTYLGGTGGDAGNGIAVDSSGNAYVTGSTGSVDFPTMNPFQLRNGEATAGSTAFVTKFNASGSALVYSTYLGGTYMAGALTAGDTGYGIAVDSGGNAYVTGNTRSQGFPTMNPFQSYNKGGNGNAFVTEFNPTGSALVYSTYLGGSGGDSGLGIAVDSSGNAYVTGSTSSTNFPTKNPLKSGSGVSADDGDAFVVKINTASSAVVYSTYLGGSGNDGGVGIAVDSSGNAYIIGDTSSTDFPTMNPLQPAYGGNSDAFVTELSASGSFLVYSTYLGGSGVENGAGIAVDSSGNVYVTGGTDSTNFPTMNPLQPAYGGNGDAFVAKFAAQSGATASMVPSSLDFGSAPVGIARGSQSIALGSTGGAALAISSIGISGTNSSDFTETNDCGTSVAAGSSCTIIVTFNPSAPGTKSASVVINDNASNSPQTVPLSGTATADFSLSAATSSNCPTSGNCSTSATVTAGQTASYNLQVAPVSGYNETVTLSCGDALAKSTCSLSPTSVTISGAAPSAFTVSVSTGAGAIMGPQTKPPNIGPTTRIVFPLLAVLVVALLLATSAVEAKQSKLRFVPALGLLLLGLAWLSACGTSGGGGGGGNTGTPSGTVTINGSSNGVNHSLSLTLNVN